MNDKPNWLAFTTKMKWVLIGTIITAGGASVNALTDSFDVSSHPWVAIVAAAVPVVLGYLPKEKNPNANQ